MYDTHRGGYVVVAGYTFLVWTVVLGAVFVVPRYKKLRKSGANPIVDATLHVLACVSPVPSVPPILLLTAPVQVSLTASFMLYHRSAQAGLWGTAGQRESWGC